jgi:hypothetical protein
LRLNKTWKRVLNLLNLKIKLLAYKSRLTKSLNFLLT